MKCIVKGIEEVDLKAPKGYHLKGHAKGEDKCDLTKEDPIK